MIFGVFVGGLLIKDLIECFIMIIAYFLFNWFFWFNYWKLFSNIDSIYILNPWSELSIYFFLNFVLNINLQILLNKWLKIDNLQIDQ